MVLLKRGKNDGIAIYIPKETILKEMAVWKLSDTPHNYLRPPLHLSWY
jgi:hypothetical protein